MKNKKLLVALLSLLKLEEKVFIEASEKEDGDDSVIQDYLKKYNAYSADDLAKLIKNSNEKYLETADFDINKVPDVLYKKIKGAALEKKEKDLAKAHSIDSYTSLDDLIQKVIAKSNDGKGTPDAALLKQIETLKLTVAEKEQAITQAEEKFTSSDINREFKTALTGLPLDYDEEALPKQHKLLEAAFNSTHKMSKKGETIIVSDEKGTMLVDKLGDPMKPSDVLKTFAEGYGFKFKQADQGGRGQGSSTGGNPSTGLKGRSFDEVRSEKNIAPNSDASDALFTEWKAANK